MFKSEYAKKKNHTSFAITFLNQEAFPELHWHFAQTSH